MPQDLYLILSSWLLVILATERTTEIIHHSKIFFPLRQWLGVRALAKTPRTPVKLLFMFGWGVVDCGWCLSVWVSFFFALFLPGECFQPIATGNLLVKWLAVVGLANLWHAIFQLVYRGRVLTVDITHNFGADYDDDDDGGDDGDAGGGDELSGLGIVIGDANGEYSESDSAPETSPAES